MYVLWTLDVQELSITASTSINGVGAISILGGIYVEEKQKKQRVRSPEDAVNIICDFIGDSNREKFVVLGLSTKNEPTVLQVVHTGSINASIVHPRDVMKALILANCASCIVEHNHPSNM